MKTKPIPAIIMLTAGFLTCVAGIVQRIETEQFIKMLLVVLIVFYVLGCLVKMVIDSNFKEVQEETTDGEEGSEEGTDASEMEEQEEVQNEK